MSATADPDDDLDTIAADWRVLHARCPTASPFQSPDWLIPWWRAFRPGDCVSSRCGTKAGWWRSPRLGPRTARTDGACCLSASPSATTPTSSSTPPIRRRRPNWSPPWRRIPGGTPGAWRTASRERMRSRFRSRPAGRPAMAPRASGPCSTSVARATTTACPRHSRRPAPQGAAGPAARRGGGWRRGRARPARRGSAVASRPPPRPALGRAGGAGRHLRRSARCDVPGRGTAAAEVRRPCANRPDPDRRNRGGRLSGPPPPGTAPSPTPAASIRPGRTRAPGRS